VTDRIRVLYPFVGDSIGGSHISTLTLIDALPKDRVQPIVAVHQQGPLTEYLEMVGIPWTRPAQVPVVKNCPLGRQVISMLRSGFLLAWFLRRHNIDIVHTNDYRMHLTWVFAVVMSGVRMIWHQRSAVRNRRLEFYSIFASKIVTISNYCKQQFMPRMASHAKVITNPVSISPGIPDHVVGKKAILNELEITREVYVIAWVGNWYPHKRPLLFIEIAHQLIDKFDIPAIFVMFGKPREPMYTKVTELIAKYGLEKSVFIMGQRMPFEPWIAGCDVLVSTAVNEGLGRTLIEAMLVGTPVVATADGGHLEVIEDDRSGRLVPPDDADAFANVIKELLKSPGYSQRLAQRGKSVAEERYSVQRHVSQIVSLYEGVMR